jgi:hypothetical protein
VVKKKAEKAAIEHYYEETEKCKDCTFISQNDPTGVMHCPEHREKITVFAAALAEREKAAGEKAAEEKAAAAGGDGAAGADGGAKPPTAPAGAVEHPPTASAAAVKPARCENCCVNPADGDSKYCDGCADDLKNEAAANGAGDGAKPNTAPAAAVEPPFCKNCRAYPADGDSMYCEGCDRALQEALKAAENKAERKRKFDAMCDVNVQYHQETSRCAECRSAKTTRLSRYCDEHQGKIDAAVEKRLSGRWG